MQLNETFDTVAELYHRARPRYPAALYDELERMTGVRRGARVLEIAPATGIVTLELARRGYDVTAVEMGRNLAAVARRNLAPFPNARVEVSRFEDWAPPQEPFDLICCATAFSWLDPAVRLEKCAAALRPGGYVAVWDTHHVAGGTGQFFIDAQECYERWDPATPQGLRLQPASQIAPWTYDIETCEHFEMVSTTNHEVVRQYTTAAYLDVLHTYSNHINLPDENAAGLFACLESLLDRRYGGHIEKAYLFQMVIARRR